MADSVFPHPRDLLPHDGHMLLVDQILAYDGKSAECLVRVDDSVLFAEADGSVPSWLALEYMAQTIAAFGGMMDRAAGRGPRPGLFVGSRSLEFHCASFRPGTLLHVRAIHRKGRSSGLAVFDCSVQIHDASASAGPTESKDNASDKTSAAATGEAPPLVRGLLNVYLLDSFDALTGGPGH